MRPAAPFLVLRVFTEIVGFLLMHGLSSCITMEGSCSPSREARAAPRSRLREPVDRVSARVPRFVLNSGCFRRVFLHAIRIGECDAHVRREREPLSTRCPRAQTW